MDNVTRQVLKILEISGLDLIPYAIGHSKFPSEPISETTKLDQIRNQVRELGTKETDDALSFSKGLLDEESARGDKIEGKAYNLISVSGISVAFITGIYTLLPKDAPATFSMALIGLLVIYFFIVISLTLTVLLASKVIIVGEYKYSSPNIEDVFSMGSQPLLETKKDRLSTYIYSYAKNSQIHNTKGSYLIGAQLWFRNSVILFLILALVLILNFIIGATINSQIVVTGTPTLLQTQSVGSSTPIILPPPITASPTLDLKPTNTPTQQILLPNPTLSRPIVITLTP